MICDIFELWLSQASVRRPQINDILSNDFDTNNKERQDFVELALCVKKIPHSFVCSLTCVHFGVPIRYGKMTLYNQRSMFGYFLSWYGGYLLARLTNWDPHIHLSVLGHHWFRLCLVAYPTPSNYLNIKCPVPREKQWNLDKKHNLLEGNLLKTSYYSGADQRKDQSSASLAFMREIHRWSVNSPHKGPVTRKMVPFPDVIMGICMLNDGWC